MHTHIHVFFAHTYTYLCDYIDDGLMTLSPHRTHFGVSGVKAASINCALTHTHMRTHTTLTKWIGNNHKIIHKHMHAHKMHT